MRKITNKKGYTLMEIVLVIAIIVIMLSAVSVGIAIDLNRYRENLDYLKEHPWEYQAVNKVRGLFGAPTPIPTASPTTEAAETTAPAEGSEAADETTAPADETTAPAAESSAPAVETEKPNTTTGVPAGWSVSSGLVDNKGTGISNIVQSGSATTVTFQAGEGQSVDLTFVRNSDGTYTINNPSSGRVDLVQNALSQYHGGLIDSNSGYVMTDGQYTWFRDNYGLSLPSGYVSGSSNTVSGGLVSSASQVYYKNDKGVTGVSSSSSNNATISINNGGNTTSFTLTKKSDGNYTLSNVGNNGYLLGNCLNGYWNGKVDYTKAELETLCSTYGITLN